MIGELENERDFLREQVLGKAKGQDVGQYNTICFMLSAVFITYKQFTHQTFKLLAFSLISLLWLLSAISFG